MTDFVTVKALHTVHHNPNGEVEVKTAADKPFKMKKADFDELFPMGAVRKATNKDLADDGEIDDRPVAEQFVPEPSPNAPNTDPVVELTPKHKGGGKWVVMRGEDVASDDGQTFENKEAAEKWIADKIAATASAAAGADLLT